MKDEADKRSEVVRFEDAMVELIDSNPELTIAEMVGVIELQLHVLKCRYYPAKPAA